MVAVVSTLVEECQELEKEGEEGEDNNDNDNNGNDTTTADTTTNEAPEQDGAQPMDEDVRDEWAAVENKMDSDEMQGTFMAAKSSGLPLSISISVHVDMRVSPSLRVSHCRCLTLTNSLPSNSYQS